MQIMRGKSRSGHGTKRPFDSDVSRMAIDVVSLFSPRSLTVWKA